MASRDPKYLIQPLQEAWPKLKQLFENKFLCWRMVLTTTYRTPEEQFKLFMEGRSLNSDGVWEVVNPKMVKTNRDGVKRLSLHNYLPAKAFDVSLINPMGIAVWTDPIKGVPEQWMALPELAKSVGLVNGGTWAKLHDWPHHELPINKPKRI